MEEDQVTDLCCSLRRIADTLTWTRSGVTADENRNVTVTEGVLGVTNALCQIVAAIDDLAQAVRESRPRTW